MSIFKRSWQQAYLAAVTETDSERLALRVAAADDAIFERLFELEGSSATDSERVALEDAMRDLRALRTYSDHFLTGRRMRDKPRGS